MYLTKQYIFLQFCIFFTTVTVLNKHLGQHTNVNIHWAASMVSWKCTNIRSLYLSFPFCAWGPLGSFSRCDHVKTFLLFTKIRFPFTAISVYCGFIYFFVYQFSWIAQNLPFRWYVIPFYCQSLHNTW